MSELRILLCWLKTMQFISIIILLAIVSIANAQKCSSPDINEDEFLFGYSNDEELLMSHTGVFKTFQMEHTTSVSSTSNSGWSKNYIDARLQDNILEIFTTENFPNYSMEQSDTSITLTITLICEGSGKRLLIFRQNIKVSYDHAPEFINAPYEFVIPLPLFKGFDLTKFHIISARDIDLKDQVTFSSTDSKDITVGTSSEVSTDGKTFYATLILSKPLLSISDKLEFHIMATDKGDPPNTSQTKVIIISNKENSLPPQPRFEKIMYEGKLNDHKELEIENIFLEVDTYANDVTFSIINDNSSLFQIDSRENEIQINLARNLQDDDIEGKSVLKFVIVANRSNLFYGRTGVVVIISHHIIEAVNDPQFENKLYTFWIKEFYIGAFGKPVATISTDDDKLMYSIMLSEYLTKKLSIDENTGELRVLTYINPDKYQFVVIASSLKHQKQGHSTVKLIVEAANDPRFENKLYTYCIKEDYIGIIGKTVADIINDDTEIIYSIQLSENLTKKISIDGNTGELRVLTHIDPDKYEFEVIATNSDNQKKGNSLVELIIEAANDPQFENKFYKFWLSEDHIGVIGKIMASVPNDESIIIYSLILSDYLSTRISIDESAGELKILSQIIPDKYEFNVVATNSINKKQGISSIELIVEGLAFNETVPTVKQTLLIKHINEEENLIDIFDLTHEDCVFSVLKIEPNDKGYIIVNETTNMLTAINIDREDEIFSKMLIPQIQVKLKLNCSMILPQYSKFRMLKEPYYTDSHNSHLSDVIDQRSLVLTDDIQFSTDITMLSLIIIDINDNYPEFIYPSKKDFIIGYPETKILENILPENLIKVEAVDMDDGTNGKLKYSILENDHFNIDVNTGIVYPFTNAMNMLDEITLSITATDLNGSPNGKSTTIEIKVKKLRSNHLTFLTFKSETSDNLHLLLRNVRNKTEIDFVILKSGIVTEPNTNDNILSKYVRGFLRQGNYEVTLKAWVYAFGENESLIENSFIKDKINAIADYIPVSASSYDDVTNDKIVTDRPHDPTGYIVAVSLLSSTVVIILVLAFLGWWCYVRPYDYERMENQKKRETTSSKGSEQQEIGYKNSNLDDNYDKNFEIYQRSSIMLSGNTEQESCDDPNMKDNQIISHNNESNKEIYGNGKGSGDNRKSNVRFNELVERIDIVRDDDMDGSSTSDVRL